MDKLMEKIKVRELQIGLSGRGVVVRHLQLVITNNFFSPSHLFPKLLRGEDN